MQFRVPNTLGAPSPRDQLTLSLHHVTFYIRCFYPLIIVHDSFFLSQTCHLVPRLTSSGGSAVKEFNVLLIGWDFLRARIPGREKLLAVNGICKMEK